MKFRRRCWVGDVEVEAFRGCFAYAEQVPDSMTFLNSYSREDALDLRAMLAEKADKDRWKSLKVDPSRDG